MGDGGIVYCPFLSESETGLTRLGEETWSSSGLNTIANFDDSLLFVSSKKEAQ